MSIPALCLEDPSGELSDGYIGSTSRCLQLCQHLRLPALRVVSSITAHYLRSDAMESTSVTSKGQVTIPKELRQGLGIRQGSRRARLSCDNFSGCLTSPSRIGTWSIRRCPTAKLVSTSPMRCAMRATGTVKALRPSTSASSRDEPRISAWRQPCRHCRSEPQLWQAGSARSAIARRRGPLPSMCVVPRRGAQGFWAAAATAAVTLATGYPPAAPAAPALGAQRLISF